MTFCRKLAALHATCLCNTLQGSIADVALLAHQYTWLYEAHQGKMEHHNTFRQHLLQHILCLVLTAAEQDRSKNVGIPTGERNGAPVRVWGTLVP